MKTYICSHVGTTEACTDCEHSIPSNIEVNIACELQANAGQLVLSFPLYYKDENSYYLMKSAKRAVKFTIYERTFFASVIADSFQLANIFSNAQRIPEEMFGDCVSFITHILKEADLHVNANVLSHQPSDSFL